MTDQIVSRLGPRSVAATVERLSAEIAARHDLGDELAARLAGIEPLTGAAIR